MSSALPLSTTPDTPYAADATHRGIRRVESLKPGSDPPTYEPLGWSVRRAQDTHGYERLFLDEKHGGTAGALKAAIAYRNEPA